MARVHKCEVCEKVTDYKELVDNNGLCKVCRNRVNGVQELATVQVKKMEQRNRKVVAHKRVHTLTVGDKEMVKRRQHFKCLDCNDGRTVLEVHHLKPVATHPELENVLNNLVALCPHCHAKRHAVKGMRKEDLLAAKRARLRR